MNLQEEERESEIGENINQEILNSIPEASDVSVSEELNKWKNIREGKKCKDYSEMSYWENKTTCTIL